MAHGGRLPRRNRLLLAGGDEPGLPLARAVGLAPLVVELLDPAAGDGQSRFIRSRDRRLAGLHALVAREQERLGLGPLPLPGEAGAEQAPRGELPPVRGNYRPARWPRAAPPAAGATADPRRTTGRDTLHAPARAVSWELRRRSVPHPSRVPARVVNDWPLITVCEIGRVNPSHECMESSAAGGRGIAVRRSRPDGASALQ